MKKLIWWWMARPLIHAMQQKLLAQVQRALLEEKTHGVDNLKTIGRLCHNYGRLERLRRGKNPWRPL